jgi:HlyD family secretion protein
MKRMRIAAALIVVAALAVVGWLLVGGREQAEDLAASGTVEAREADLGFQAGGRLAVVAAEEGERVAAGQVLAVLDTAELAARRSAARAQVDGAAAALAELRRGARPEERRQAEAALQAAEARLAEAVRTLERTRRLHDGGAVSQQELERAATAAEVARTARNQAAEQLDLTRTGPRQERIDAAAAQLRQAQAAVEQVGAALDNAIIRAPFAGVVTVRHREAGEAVGPGQPVLTVMDPADAWVRIYVAEDRVGRVALGQAARITVDSYPDQAYEGRVTFIASQAEFTPRNVQTPEERVKLVYAVKVAVSRDTAGDLKPGMPADVTLAR